MLPSLAPDSARLAFAARDWLRYRNWTGTLSGPRLGDLGVVTHGGAFAAVRIDSETAAVTRLGTWREPEHAQRYVEHVHNFGRPPT